jgi:dihydrofolate reductase
VEEAVAAAGEVEEMIVAGGAEVYAAFLGAADRLYLTQIEGAYDGDTYFPYFDAREWVQVFSQTHQLDERHEHQFRWIILERKRE